MEEVEGCGVSALERIKALCEEATEGPWELRKDSIYRVKGAQWWLAEFGCERDAALASHARQLVPLMLCVIVSEEIDQNMHQLALNNLKTYCAEHLPEPE